MLFLGITTLLQGQIVNTRADSVYDGWIRAYLVKSGTQTYFTDGLFKRTRAFFWGQAYLITTAEDAYEAHPTAARKQQITDLLNTLLANESSDWKWDSWNDDVEWAIIACIRGYRITGNTAYLNAAANNWKMVWNRGWDTRFDGGIWELMDDINTGGGKGGLSNWPFIISGCMLYETTKDIDYLNKCKQDYAWARTRCYDPISGRVYEGIGPTGIGGDDNSYNSGLLVNAASSLYKITKDPLYYNDAMTAADHYIGRIGGLATGIMTEDHPANGSFGSDQFARGLAKFATENNLWTKYWQFMMNNSNAAWNHRRVDYNFTWNNFLTNTTTVPSTTTATELYAMEVQSSVTVAMVTPVAQSIPDTIEAENYNFMKGILVQTCSEGGLKVGSIDTGDWLEYIIKVPVSNYYNITYRVAGTSLGTASLLQNGDTLATTSIPNTGSLSTWVDVSTLVYLKAGIQSIRLAANVGGWNLNKFSAISCQTIVPYISVNGATAKQTANITINAGDAVSFQPQSAPGTWNWTGPNGFTADTKDVNLTNVQQEQGGVYTATYTCSEGCFTVRNFRLTINGCTPTAIVPYIKANKNGSWQQLASVALIVGDTVSFSPKPEVGGTWSWTGPNGFTSDSREITLNNIITKQAGKYTATYYNDSGCKSTQVFTVSATGDDPCGTAIDPYATVNGGAWQQVSSVSLNIGGRITVGPHPVDGGTWKWSGPNGFTASAREFSLSNFNANQAGYYTATYTNSTGCVSSKKFIIGVNNCVGNSITPDVLIDGVSSQRTDSLIVSSGSNITITPPAVDGVWSWTGPNNFKSNSRQISISQFMNKHEGNYVVNYFNAAGCKSTYTVNLNVDGNDYCSTAIVPYYSINSGVSWVNSTKVSLKSGNNVTFGPKPLDKGYWVWTGPKNFIAFTREFTLTGVTVAQAGTYVAIFTNNDGCANYLNFTLTVDGVSANSTIEDDKSELQFYPNPATDKITLKGLPANTTIAIVDLSGRSLLLTQSSDKSGDTTIDINNLKAGVYLIKVGNAESKTFKLTKQ